MQTIDQKEASVFRFALPFGLASGIGFVLLFLLFSLIGLAENTTFRMINYVILGIAMFFAIRKFRIETDGGMNYLEGLGTGFVVSGIGFGILSVFLLIYFGLINPALLETLVETTRFGRYLTPSSAAIMVFLEGIAGGGILSFILMQYFKQNRYH